MSTFKTKRCFARKLSYNLQVSRVGTTTTMWIFLDQYWRGKCKRFQIEVINQFPDETLVQTLTDAWPADKEQFDKTLISLRFASISSLFVAASCCFLESTLRRNTKSTLYNRCRRRLGDFSVLLKVKTLEMLNLFLFLSFEPSKITIGFFPISVLLI